MPAPPFHSIARSSEGAHDLGGLEFVTVKSAHLHGRADLCAHVPPQAKGQKDVPVVILLHGVTASFWAWASLGGAHKILDRMILDGRSQPMILAMPSDGLRGCGSGYLPIPSEGSYEGWIVDELPRLMRELYPEVSEQSSMFLDGMSMGGYGALRLGAKHPGVFTAFSGHSSITTFRRLGPYIQEALDSFGPITPEEGDVLPWLIKNRETLTPFRFDCGTEDDLIEANRELHRSLTAEKIPHGYAEAPGDHVWDYWAVQLEESLSFFNEQLS